MNALVRHRMVRCITTVRNPIFINGFLHTRSFSSYGDQLCFQNDSFKLKEDNKVWDTVEDKLKVYKLKYVDLQGKMDKYKNQIFSQVNVIKKSINEANKKIEEQEKEGADEKLNFKRNAQTSDDIIGLPSDRELNRKQWKRKLEFYLDSLQETIFTATRALNDVTGYSSIQTLRNSITIMEKQLDVAKQDVKNYKSQYDNAIDSRATSQKQLNELLQRKSSWTPQELKQFTDLYQADATNSQNEKKLKAKLIELEAKEIKLEDELYRAILTRYHEEQIWSDKIRRTSTWGTFFLMGMNIILFLVFQLLLEPWKRRRLTRSFEDKVKTALQNYSHEQNENTLELLKQHNILTTTKKEEGNLDIEPDSTPSSLLSENTSTDIPSESEGTTNTDYSFPNILAKVKHFGIKLMSLSSIQGTNEILLSNAEFYIYSSCLIAVGALINGIFSNN
ncbi:similar to Saccharomyces cerevisiae YDR393W SHE9 Mitochondrial inner membrane protein required for normal mitochondrial morphology, may be involved in fission of the inner membrane [Maudiozyma saulgeensis]|uniref:Sensitive to high expression protein 9, mitochondrial n=1 Tax=Maudiozyma saulgeensis TaxID=1789683 RepID=A0A1X7R1X1_9SACH|nr:similar to Saccharomyces cerevisiae YDR393W SHE9 Mitochondrial inner membrane protein required for normal mitochondrial morphology, may be involved in fission of the inner membrane [Kazachstania saulgeensis]